MDLGRPCLSAVLALLSPLSVACLPADTRPVPGKVVITVSPSDATVSGFTTADEWTVAFERVLIGIGHTSLGPDCTSYSEARYARLLDLSAGSPQVLGLLFGLGTCDIWFRIAPPDSDTVLGAGVSEADEVFMRAAATDGYFVNAGVAFDVAGSAVHGDTTERFHWSFRQNVRYTDCALTENGTSLVDVRLRSNDDFSFDLSIETEALFRDSVDASEAALRFAPFAAADAAFGDADGIITLGELGRVPVVITSPAASTGSTAFRVEIPPLSDAGSSAADAADERATSTRSDVSLADYVYLFLVPTLPRFRDGGRCINHPRTN